MFLITQKSHLFNIFTLKHDLHTFVEKMSRVAFTHFYGPNRLEWFGGVEGGGCQPNLGNVCNLGTNGPAAPPLPVFVFFGVFFRGWGL